ncbi:MAG: DUF922 domain-containing protein [Pseudomonadota bacterium]
MIKRFAAAFLVFASLVAPAHAWEPKERVEAYAIAGTTPRALYRSIGERGPKTSVGNRAIAVTEWKLLWRRDYQKRGDGCELASALPFLTITYKLPRPAEKLSGQTARRWKTFANGIRVHEEGHGVLLQAMTDTIIRETVGLKTLVDDGNCNALRAQVLDRVKVAFDDYRRNSADFDRIEMAPGGNVHKLVLGLLNG